VPPLPLTGERTLPDVPEENYWYRRHLVVYEWIAARVGGRRVVDMACGEGYGSDVLASTAAGVIGVDANPEAHEHARLRYVRPNLRFERDLVESFSEPCDAVVSSTCRTPARFSSTSNRCSRPAGSPMSRPPTC
jgi:SAM-dependent methyltransferase